jgi:hypothetical protein
MAVDDLPVDDDGLIHVRKTLSRGSLFTFPLEG